MKLKKSLFLCLLVLMLLWVPWGVQAGTFTDVADDAWYADAVNYCYDKDYFAGLSETEFGPDHSMTRAMLVTVLYRCAGSPSVTVGADFTDVPQDEWYTKAVAWGQSTELAAGYDDGTFRPGQAVSRQEIMAFFYRYVTLILEKDIPDNVDERIFNSFSDGVVVGDWAKTSVKWCTSVGLICGYNGEIQPQATSTRAQIASIMMRMDSYLAGNMAEITAETGTGGKVIPAGTFSLVENSSVYFRMTADNGYVLDDVILNGKSQGRVTAITVSSGKTAQTLKASFRQIAGDYQSGVGQLVNRTYPILMAANYTPSDLTSVKYAVAGRNVKLQAEAAAALDKMIAAYRGENSGSKLYAQSGYRTYQYQKTLYQNQIDRKGGNIYKAGVVSAIPGTSEHELGLAVDLTADGTLEQSFGSTRQGKWLAAHCREYGFILRYPADKQMVTGIIYEPWHFRYVGTAITEDMTALNISTLEEYYNLPLADKDIDPYAPYLK